MEGRAGDATGWSGADALAALACGLVGLALAVVPHLARLAAHGTPEYVSDWDEILYLSIAKAPYHAGTLSVTDPFSAPEIRPTIYPAAIFVPPALALRALGGSPLMLSLAWRALGGLALGASAYFLFRRGFSDLPRARAWALVATMICLGDSGFDSGRSFLGNALTLAGYSEGSDYYYLDRQGQPSGRPNQVGQYRVFNPLLCLPMLLVVAGVLTPERRPGRGMLALGVAAMGLLVLTNFYMWTSAALALTFRGAALYLRARSDPTLPGPERDAWRAYAIVLLGGLTIGAPQVALHSWTFAEPQYREIMIRTAKYGRYALDDPLRWRYLGNSWVWAKLAVGALAMGALGLPRLALAWSLTLAGFLMSNSVLVLGVDFENPHFHYVYSPFGEVLLLAVAVRLACRWGRERSGLAVLGAAAAAMVVSCAAIRAEEALETPISREIAAHLRELGPLRPALAALEADATISFPRGTRIVTVLSPATPLYFSPYTWSSMIPDRAVDERHALNAWLQGFDARSYEDLVGRDIERWGHSRYPIEEVLPRRRPIFRAILEGEGEALVERYRVRYLLLPSDAPAPTRGGPWTRRAGDDRWTLWARRAGTR